MTKPDISALGNQLLANALRDVEQVMGISFTVPTIPVSQPRQRHRQIGGFVQNYTPTKHPVNAFKAAVQMAAQAAYSGPPLDGPLWASIVFVMPRPQSMMWKTKPMPRIPDYRKPDRDNLMKSLQDALEGLLFVNDSQIASGPVEKWIASGDEQPHVEVMFKRWDHNKEMEG